MEMEEIEMEEIEMEEMEMEMEEIEMEERIEMVMETEEEMVITPEVLCMLLESMDKSKITENSQENRQKRTRERMSDQSQRNHASAFYSQMQETTVNQTQLHCFNKFKDCLCNL
ncbi:hypothetical protein Tco_1421248 [Tanacetum coccineum]